MAEVPSVTELAHVGLAHRDISVRKGDVARYRVTDEGHALMGKAMRENAQEAIAAGDGDWYPDPPHRRPRSSNG